MTSLARWTNLSETTFLLPPKDPSADYLVRIFTPLGELPFAGHPTLGSCQAWPATGDRPMNPQVVVQECGIGEAAVREVRWVENGPPWIGVLLHDAQSVLGKH